MQTVFKKASPNHGARTLTATFDLHNGSQFYHRIVLAVLNSLMQQGAAVALLVTLVLTSDENAVQC